MRDPRGQLFLAIFLLINADVAEGVDGEVEDDDKTVDGPSRLQEVETDVEGGTKYTISEKSHIRRRQVAWWELGVVCGQLSSESFIFYQLK